MTTNNESSNRPTRCLDIVIDHRTRALFQHLQKRDGLIRSQPHIEYIRRLAEELQNGIREDISENEIQVTQDFAGKGAGGLLVVLLQPSNSHPFDEPLATIVEECPTYSAINECIRAATCGTLTIADISLIDSLPFIRNKDGITANNKKRVREWVIEIIKMKKPDVILCMWQGKEGVPLRLSAIRGQGVGRQFPTSAIRWGDTKFERVNAFHPSYAVNFNPSISCFRQLLLLEITKSCRKCANDWSENRWMWELRRKCQSTASLLSFQNGCDLAYLTRRLKQVLCELRSSILSLETSSNEICKDDRSVYQNILRYNLTESCNDASLCLRELSYRRITDLSIAEETIISHSVTKSIDFLDKILHHTNRRPMPVDKAIDIPGLYGEKYLEELLGLRFYANWMKKTSIPQTITSFLRNLNAAFQPVQLVTGGNTFTVCHGVLSNVFLEFAEGIESSLGELLFRQINTGDNIGSLVDSLSNIHFE